MSTEQQVSDPVRHQEATDKLSAELKARLMLAGFKVHEVELTEFLKAGGSAKCLSLKLSEPVKRR